MLKRILWLLLAPAAFLAGGALSDLSFESLRDMRQLERVPPSEPHAVLPGEVNVSGVVRELPSAPLLRSPKTGTPCAYFRYTIEEERRDSDGDTHWSTIHDEERYVSFLLAGAEGSVRIVPASDIGWNVGQSHSHQEGKRRYTEYRLEPGETVFIFGYAEERADDSYQGGTPPSYPPGESLTVCFSRKGEYTSIISELGEASARRGMASASVFACLGGLACLSLCVVALCSALRIHHVLAYLVLVGAVLSGGLVHFGLRMMRDDLEAAHARIERTRAAVRAAFASADADPSGPLDGRPDAERSRLGRIRIDLARAIERTNRLRGQVPERWLAPLWGVPYEEPISLSDADREAAARHELAFEPATIHPAVGWPFVAAGLVLGGLFSRSGFRRIKEKRAVENIPTSKTAGVAYGLAEIQGTIVLPEARRPLSGPISSRACVQYRYVVKEKRGTGKKASWVTLEDRDERIAFRCRDADGEMAVVPAGAEVITRHATSRRASRKRFYETRLEVGDPLYCLGSAEIEPEAGMSLEMRRGPADVPYILSNLSEAEIMDRKGRSGLWWLNFAIDAIVMAVLFGFGLAGAFTATDYLTAALVPPVYLLGVYCLVVYNDLVFLRQRVRRNRSNIDVALKKRFDLLPNLERVAKAYLAHEAGVMEKLASLRQALAPGGGPPVGLAAVAGGGGAAFGLTDVAGFIGAEHAIVTRLVALREANPALKGDTMTGELMRSLVRLENEVALMREGYNSAVERHNTRIGHFPELLFAKAFGFREEGMLRFELEVSALPEVPAPEKGSLVSEAASGPPRPTTAPSGS